jgi:ParB-like chromosome segregation protein Spo0J
VGLLHPIVVNEKAELVAGMPRLEACKALGWSRIPVHTVNILELNKGELHENTVRKDFLASDS